MKYSYCIMTDATANFPKKFYEEEFGVMPMDYSMDGKLYRSDNALTPHEFYEKMRAGSMPTTSLINTHTAIEYFTPILKKGQDVFAVSFSSALSGTYRSLSEAKEELSEKFPDRRIYILDSTCASGGEGLLVYYCLKKRREGASFDELISYSEDLKQHINHNFTVDNLMHLYRGGRLSKTAAIVGTAIQVKPILDVNTAGELTPVSKVVGRRTSLKAIVDKMVADSVGYDNSELIIIEHGDCLADAKFVEDKIRKRFGYKNFEIEMLSPVIGAHSGPDTVSFYFLGKTK